MAVMLALIACSEKHIAEAKLGQAAEHLYLFYLSFLFILSLSNQIPVNMELHSSKRFGPFTLVQSNQVFNILPAAKNRIQQNSLLAAGL